MPDAPRSKLARRIGARLRAVREEAGVTQERLAWDCELTKGFLSQVEAGTSLPSLETLYALAERLDVDVVDLLAFEADNPQHRLLDAVRSMDGKAARAALRDLGL